MSATSSAADTVEPPTPGELLPWLRPDWQGLHRRLMAGRLPHALLFTGVPGVGKQAFARFVAQSLACECPEEQAGPCQQCQWCQQWLAGSSPDFQALGPDEPGGLIKIDAVRALVDWMQLTSGAGARRVALIDPADSMNRNAANSLLKTLEEPGHSASILLVSDRPGALPATLRSRCQQMTLRVNDPAAALAWLGNSVPDAAARLAEGRVGPRLLRAQGSDQWQTVHSELLSGWHDLLLHRRSVGRLVEALAPHGTHACLRAFARWCHLAARAASQAPMNVSSEEQKVLEAVYLCLKNEQWLTLHAQILRLQRIDSTSFKTQAVLEGLLADIRGMTNG